MNVIDVDFKYVERSVPVLEYGPGVGKIVPVLQWRKKIIDSRYKHPGEGEWTEWQDVRTEVE